MEATHRYMNYLISENPIYTDEGKKIEVFHLDIQDDPEIFEEWAKQFRRNYCSDDELQEMTNEINISSNEYLKNYKLPSDSDIGLSTMSGDFGEILVSDYLQYFEEYDVPRTRYDSKVNKRLLGNIQRDKTNETSNNSYHRLKQEKKIQTKQQQL